MKSCTNNQIENNISCEYVYTYIYIYIYIYVYVYVDT